MSDQDHSDKLLFSHPRMVQDLLQGFVDEDWVGQVDFSTLERVSGSYVSDDLREREDDVIWRVLLPARVLAADAEQLLVWGERILSAETLTAVFSG